MSKSCPVVFIGGPADGRREVVQANEDGSPRPHIEMRKLDDPPPLRPKPEQCSEPVEVETVIYERRGFQERDELVWVYVYPGVNPFKLLLEGYNPK